MKLEQSFDVAAPLDRVWKALIDVEHVAPCLPGAAVTGRNDDGSYNGTFTVKIGPTTASYTGKLEMREVDEGDHTATMHANGSDKRGQGGATATILSSLSPVDEDNTRVEVITDYHITGRLARFGRSGMIEDISQKLLRQFADRLQASLTTQPVGASQAAAAPPASAPAAQAAADGGGGDRTPASAGAAAAASSGMAGAGAGGAGADDGGAGAGDGGAGAGAGGASSSASTSVGATTPNAAGEAPEAAAAAASDAAGTTDHGQADASASPPPPSLPPLEPAEPIQGISLMGSVVWGRVRRNPAPVAFVVGLLIAFLVVRRARR
jgi:carbon monoxide dehydrogenase subunit G